MPLRILETTLSGEHAERVPELLDDAPTLHVWTSSAGQETALVRVLCQAEDAEAVSDILVDEFGSDEGFRLIALSVEATLPTIEEPEDANAASEAGKQSDGGERISREELYEDLRQASRLTRVYLVMVALSTIVAAVGLIRGDLAIVIGAMVIAPLLGPNMSLSLACTLGDVQLGIRSLRTLGAGIATAGILSIALGAVLTLDPEASAIADRTHAHVGDVILALSAGAAGSLAFTGGAAAVVVGVMVSVALLPPLVVAGLLAGAGHTGPAAGALMLAVTNVTCINLAAVATFLVQRVRPRTWWEAERARKATWIAVTTWIAMLLVLLGLMLVGYIRSL